MPPTARPNSAHRDALGARSRVVAPASPARRGGRGGRSHWRRVPAEGEARRAPRTRPRTDWPWHRRAPPGGFPAGRPGPPPRCAPASRPRKPASAGAGAGGASGSRAGAEGLEREPAARSGRPGALRRGIPRRSVRPPPADRETLLALRSTPEGEGAARGRRARRRRGGPAPPGSRPAPRTPALVGPGSPTDANPRRSPARVLRFGRAVTHRRRARGWHRPRLPPEGGVTALPGASRANLRKRSTASA